MKTRHRAKAGAIDLAFTPTNVLSAMLMATSFLGLAIIQLAV